MSCDRGFSRILARRGGGYAFALLAVIAVLWRVIAGTSPPAFPESSPEGRPGTDAASPRVPPSPRPDPGSPKVGQTLARVVATSDPKPGPQVPSQRRRIQTMLSGSVLRAGEPVPGAEVRVRTGGLFQGVGGDLVRTGVAGTYLFPKLSPGLHTVTVVESDQLLAGQEIELAYGDRRVLDVEVATVTRFRGRLRAPGGCPFTGLRVQFVPEWISSYDRPPNYLFSWAVDRNAVQVGPDGSFEFPAVVAQAGALRLCMPSSYQKALGPRTPSSGGPGLVRELASVRIEPCSDDELGFDLGAGMPGWITVSVEAGDGLAVKDLMLLLSPVEIDGGWRSSGVISRNVPESPAPTTQWTADFGPVPAGRYRATLSAITEGWRLPLAEPIDAKPGEVNRVVFAFADRYAR